MATKKATTAKGLRASARLPLSIDCSKQALRNLMTEQCRIPGGFATFYTGTRTQFMAAGFPEKALPAERRTKLRLAPGGACYQPDAEGVDAWFDPSDRALELEIHWSPKGPGGCCHPALREMGRIATIAARAWVVPSDWQSLEAPIERLLDNPDLATDYRMAPDLRFQYTKAFKTQVEYLVDCLLTELQSGEIMPLASAAAPAMEEAPELASLDAERIARSAIASARAGRAGT